jgi:hypothetical protein
MKYIGVFLGKNWKKLEIVAKGRLSLNEQLERIIPNYSPWSLVIMSWRPIISLSKLKNILLSYFLAYFPYFEK